MKNIKLPTASKFTVLRQFCNYIPNHLVPTNCAKSFVTREGVEKGLKGYVAPEVGVTVGGMDKTMSQPTRTEVLRKLRRRYERAGLEHKSKLLDQAQELLGYHRKSAIRALRAPRMVRGPLIITGRPVSYEAKLLLPF